MNTENKYLSLYEVLNRYSCNEDFNIANIENLLKKDNCFIGKINYLSTNGEIINSKIRMVLPYLSVWS